MKLRRRWILVTIAALSVPLLAAGASYLALLMALSGTWPFEPLQRRVREMELPNGAVIRIEGVEDRGWQSDGFLWAAGFRQPNETEFVRFAAWIGPNENLRVYLSGPLVVCPNPDLRTIHVRGSNGEWKSFDLALPGRTDNLADFSRFRAAPLAEHDLRRFQADLPDAETTYSPTTYIQTFDPLTREIRAEILAVLRREAVFEISEDGQAVSLKSLRRVEQ